MIKPKPATPEDEHAALVDYQRKTFCDVVVERAIALMAESGASGEMICERLLTHMTVRAASITPAPHLADAFRQHARAVEQGIFHNLTGEAGKRH